MNNLKRAVTYTATGAITAILIIYIGLRVIEAAL